MFKLSKEIGRNSNVILTNTDTNHTFNLGRVTIPILDVLTKADVIATSAEDPLKPHITDTWEVEITEELKNSLVKMFSHIHKPVRIKNNAVTPAKKVDAIDVLLGLAHY